MARRSIMGSWVGSLSIGALAAATALAPSVAFGEVRHQGDWSSDDPEVSLDLENVPRGEAVNRLAAAAGWSVVINAPKSDPVSVHVTDQPASKVLDLLLADGRYVARRSDDLVSIAPDDGAPGAPAATPSPVTMGGDPPNPPARPVNVDVDSDSAHDRLVTGGNLRIDAGEVVRDVTVMGGNLDVWGTVTGDLSVMGGNARIHKGAHVKGDAAAVGGTLTIESGAAVDGDLGVLGGVLHKEDGARVGGDVHQGMLKERHPHGHRGHDAKAAAVHDEPQASSRLERLARDAADAINAAAVLFAFGAVLLALAPVRMERFKVQIAAHPARSFAMGVVGVLLGALIAAALCLTLIGIPFAVVGLLCLVIATLAGVCSVLETVGGALLSHRTRNPYVHLACGGLVFLVAGAIPFVGWLVKLAVVLTALGSVVATRCAGLVPLWGRFAEPDRQADAI